MNPRKSRSWKPVVEAVEPRRLLSVATAGVADGPRSVVNPAQTRSTPGDRPATSASTAPANSRSGFTPSQSSIALPENQGQQGTNLLLQPVGRMTPRQYRISRYAASFVGAYTIGPGQYDSEAFQVAVQGVGRTTNMAHADVQLGAVVASDPNIQNSGAGSIFDRNQNSNSSWMFFLASPRGDVDAHGRPNRFESVSTDANISGGAFVQGFSQGVLQIRYVPNGRRAPGVIEQGKAYIRFTGQIYSPNISNILRNARINP